MLLGFVIKSIDLCINKVYTNSGGDEVFSSIQKWGNSQAVRIPKAILEKAALKENDKVEIRVEDGKMVISPVKRRVTLAERIAEYQGEYKCSEFETGKPVGKEVL